MNQAVNQELVGPAVELYATYNTYPHLKQKLVACFDVLKEMKHISNHGLHDDVPGSTTNPFYTRPLLKGVGHWSRPNRYRVRVYIVGGFRSRGDGNGFRTRVLGGG